MENRYVCDSNISIEMCHKKIKIISINIKPNLFFSTRNLKYLKIYFK